MAREIEDYLREKFEQGLRGSSKIPMFSQFQKTKTLLEEINLPSSADRSNIRGNLYSLNNLLSECQMLSEKHYFCWSPEELLTINNIRVRLKKIRTELKKMKDSSGNDAQPNGASSLSGDAHSTQPRSTSRSVDESRVYGFDDDVTALERLLLRRGSIDGFKAIAVVGTKGIGKTTLCQMIFNRAAVKSYFLPRIWVCMSELQDNDQADPHVSFVKRLLVSLGVEEETMGTISDSHGFGGLLCALYQQLVGKRYLIVLDDARGVDSWYEQLHSEFTGDYGKWGERLAYGLPKGCGGTVIVSTRYEGAAKMMVGETNLYHLLPLSDNESCWKIFEDSVTRGGAEEYNPPNKEDLKVEVRKKCAGIPLAARMMGEIKHKQREEAPRSQVPQP